MDASYTPIGIDPSIRADRAAYADVTRQSDGMLKIERALTVVPSNDREGTDDVPRRLAGHPQPTPAGYYETMEALRVRKPTIPFLEAL